MQLEEALPFTVMCMELTGSGAARAEQHWTDHVRGRRDACPRGQDAITTPPTAGVGDQPCPPRL